MINFKLEYNDLIPQDKFVSVIPVTKDNYRQYFIYIVDTIHHFNDELEWNGMFTIDDAKERLEKGMSLYLGMSGFGVYGHVWFRDYFASRILFNVFVRNQVEKKPFTGKEFVSNVLSRYEKNRNIYCQVDEWNEKSIRMFKSLGFKQFDN